MSRSLDLGAPELSFTGTLMQVLPIPLRDEPADGAIRV